MKQYKVRSIVRRRPIGDVSLITEENISPLLKQLYVQRGIKNIKELSRSVHSLLTYHQLNGIKNMVALLEKALKERYKLMIIGDFDVDGATSVSLIMLALKKMGVCSINFLVPNRISNGYGLSTDMVELSEKYGAQMILTVDNGISSHDGVDLAHKKGILVLITDHHLPGETLPNADAIINPNLYNCNFPSKSLSGVGVAFYLMLALRKKLNEDGWFERKKIVIPKMSEFLDLVALGTIADVVPLDTNNRILVYQGINRIRAGKCRVGILALAEVANCEISRLCSNDLSFFIGPRLNAAGRIADMSIGISLLLTDDLSKARMLARKLDILNHIRKKIEKRMEIEAINLLHKKGCKKSKIPNGLVLYHTSWHQGIIGILASRLKEKFQRPVIAFAPAGNDLLKGSGRSTDNIHMYDLLKILHASYPGMIVKFGGHAKAVGLMLKKTQFNLFHKKFIDIIDNWLDPMCLENIIWSDGSLNHNEFSLTTVEVIRNGGPWGQDFPHPVFDGQFRILHQDLINKKHLRLVLEPIGYDNIIDGIVFNIDSTLWPDKRVNIVELVYKLGVSELYGKHKVQLIIQNIWPL